MRSVIYARRSQEHQEESVERQIQLAREYIARKGWDLKGEYRDDQKNTGRREFVKRTEFLRLLADAEEGAFDIIVCRDHTRLGGDTSRTMRAIEDLADAKVKVFYYLHDREVKIGNWTDKILLAVESGAAEGERDAIASRTHEALQMRAKSALVAGGAVYGYDLIPILEGSVKRRTEYRINEAEATVLREMFERYASGHGLKLLAKDLNARGVPSPKAGTRGTGTWSPSSIRPMLMRPRYTGRIIWGKKQKTYKKGTKVRILRPESEWTKVDSPQLRIIDDALWAKVQARFESQKHVSGKCGPTGPKPVFLLVGLGRCSVCGGAMGAENKRWGSNGQTRLLYYCRKHRMQGAASCGNGLRRPVEDVDTALLDFIGSEILNEATIVETLREVRRRLAERSKDASRDEVELTAQVKKLRAEIERLAEALMATDDRPATIVRMMASREAQLTEIEGRLSASRAAPGAVDLEVRKMEREAKVKLRDLRALLVSAPEDMRRAVEALLDGPISFEPVSDLDGDRQVTRYRLTGKLAIGACVCATEGVSLGTLTVTHTEIRREIAALSIPFDLVA